MRKVMPSVCALGAVAVLGATGTAAADDRWPPGVIHNQTGQFAYVNDF